MKRIFLFLILLTAAHHATAGTPRALIIGINQYKAPVDSALNSPRSMWRNLSGCVNDAEAMRDLIMARYGFTKQHITTLLNTEASRARIIEELKKLVSLSVKGDVVLIFYAGHGSQMVNSLSKENDKKDETIVPADAYKGVADIRDKELAFYFNQLLDKGVVLTVILDSCHSGSAGRGLLHDVEGVRYIDENPTDAKDPTEPLRPEDRGALILSAAQDDEFAKELKDENNLNHGAFTLALLKALQQNPVDAPVDDIYNSALAIMKFYGKTQQPVLAANEQRKKQTLFGFAKGSLKNRIAIAVSKIDASGIELMGGYALGLAKDVKLKSITGNDTIQVMEMRSANRSIARPVGKKKPTITPGSLFEVVSWKSSAAPALKVYIPENSLQGDELQAALKSFQTLRTNKKILTPELIVKEKAGRIYNYSKGSWIYDDVVASNAATAGAVFNFPPPQGMLAAFSNTLQAYNNVEIVHNAGESLYSLLGTVNEKNELVYGFVKTHIGVEDTSGSLPPRTDYFVYNPSKGTELIVDKLTESLFRIAKIRDWLLLQPPQGDNRFPFQLQVEQYSAKQAVKNSVAIGDTLSFYLQKSNSTATWNRKKRYVYVFLIDSKGGMSLLYPDAASGNVENRFPVTDGMKREDRSLLFDMQVTPPAGADNYFMLTTEEAIGNLSAFEQPGVISRGPATGKDNNPLESLLFTGTKSRNNVTTPVNWSIEKLILKSVEKKN